MAKAKRSSLKSSSVTRSKTGRKKVITKSINRYTCGTRFMKNVMHIERTVPNLVSRGDPAASITKMVSPQMLEKIHTIDNVKLKQLLIKILLRF